MKAYPIKLVRDDIEADVGGGTIVYEPTDQTTHKQLLQSKLLEEVGEYLRSPSKEELADLLEICHGLAEVDLGIDFIEVEWCRQEKLEKRGGFYKGVVMSIQKDG